MTSTLDSIRYAYDAVSDAYAARFLGELTDKPLDRALLDWFAGLVRGAGPVADLGCGPGQIARALHERGVDAFGIDLSPRMVALARHLHRDRGIDFQTGDLFALQTPDASLAGATAFYAHVHVPLRDLTRAFSELQRVLRPGAPALLSFHVGEETVHLETFLERSVELEFHFFPMAAVVEALGQAGLRAEVRLERAPYVPREHPSIRGYVLARRPAE